MGISFQEFKTAMEVFSVKRLKDYTDIQIDHFDVSGVKFEHSGSYYVVLRGMKGKDEVFNRAMKELGDEDTESMHLGDGEIHSIKELLTFVLMLEGVYSKELMEELMNETYKRLFSCSLIRDKTITPFDELSLLGMKNLRKSLDEYDNVVNPFGNSNISLKEPRKYFNDMDIEVDFNKQSAVLGLSSEELKTMFYTGPTGWSYIANIWADDLITIYHYDNKHDDEVVALSGMKDGDKDIDLKISMRTGLAWQTDSEKEPTLITIAQVKTMITYLKKIIKIAKRTTVGKMIDED